MDTPPASAQQDSGGTRERVRFGPFELHLRTGELWRDGKLVRLQNQPFRVLAALVSRPGELVTREELRHEIWPEGTFVDFESSLNFCVRHIRAALGDQATSPSYIETLPRRGYRFVAPVEAVGAAPVPRTTAATASAPGPSPRRHLPIALLLAIALAAMVGTLGTGGTGPSPETRFQRVTFRRGFVDSARFMPGGQLVYAAGWDGFPARLHLLNETSREDDELPLEVSEVLATTPAGEVLYRSGTTLRRVALRGGTAKDVATGVLAADVTADGNEVALARLVDGRVLVELPAGRVVSAARFPSHLRISPDGRRVAFFEHPFANDDRGDVVVVDREGHRLVLASGWSSTTGLAWSPDGREVWFTAAASGIDAGLHAVGLDGQQRALAPALGRLVIHDVARDGRVLVERNTERLETRVGTLGSGERDLSFMDATLVVDMSPDGEHVVFVESGEGGGPDYSVYLRKVDGSLPVRLGPGRGMALSPDGRWVAAVPPREPDVVHLLPVGSGEVRSLRHADGGHVELATFLPDGRLLYTARHPDGRRQTFVRDVDGGPPRVLPGGAVVDPAVTADGTSVVAETPGGPQLVDVDGTRPPRPLAGLGSARALAWLGSDLVVREPGGPPTGLTRLAPDGSRTPYLRLAPDDRTGVVALGSVVLSDDGRRYAYSFVRRASDLFVLTGVR